MRWIGLLIQYQANRINYQCGNMKSSAYVLIDAHIIRCRLHHVNSLQYSVGLKSGKDQLIATNFKPSTNLIIEMDTHLSLQADKHSYDQFPKLTLIVNVLGEHNEKKTVGTTFTNFRKQGVQTFQVSECSCKDKAFEVDICFTTKIIEAKSSNTKLLKNQIRPQNKNNFLSQQPTPRHSRMNMPDTAIKGLKQQLNVESPQKMEQLRAVKSQKMIKALKPVEKYDKKLSKNAQDLQKELAVLNQKMLQYESKVGELKQFKQLLYDERIKCQKWYELLKLQQQKNSEAMRYIIALEQILLGIIPKDNSKTNITSIKNFKVIEEKDEIILMNEELQSQLQKQKQKTKYLHLQIDKLKQDISDISSKLKESQDRILIKNISSNNSSAIRVKNQIINQLPQTQQIMITSRCHENKEGSINTQTIQIKKSQLSLQIQYLQKKFQDLKLQVNKLLTQKINLENQIQRLRSQNKKPPTNLTSKPPIKKQQTNKLKQKGNSKQKNSKLPPVKPVKRNLPIIPQNTQIQAKKTAEVNNSMSTADKKTKVSTEAESKTEREESMGKSSELIFNEVKSERPPQNINEVIYYTNNFHDQITDF